MKTAAIKTSLYKLIDEVEDKPILKAVYAILAKFVTKQKGVDFWDELSEEEQQDIMAGLEELERGESYSHEEVMSKYR